MSTFAHTRARLGRRIEDHAATGARPAADSGSSAPASGGARVLPFCWSAGARGDAAPRRPAGGGCSAPCRGPGRDGARGSLERPLDRTYWSSRPTARKGRSWYGRPGRRRAARVAAGAQACGRERWPDEGRAVVPRARRARPSVAGPRRHGPDPGGRRTVLALAGLFRPAREPRAAADDPGRDRRLKDARPGLTKGRRLKQASRFSRRPVFRAGTLQRPGRAPRCPARRTRRSARLAACVYPRAGEPKPA